MTEAIVIGLLVWFAIALLVGVGLGRLLQRRERAGREAHEQHARGQRRSEANATRSERRR